MLSVDDDLRASSLVVNCARALAFSWTTQIVFVASLLLPHSESVFCLRPLRFE